jgi:hypothetical protein
MKIENASVKINNDQGPWLEINLSVAKGCGSMGGFPIQQIIIHGRFEPLLCVQVQYVRILKQDLCKYFGDISNTWKPFKAFRTISNTLGNITEVIIQSAWIGKGNTCKFRKWRE